MWRFFKKTNGGDINVPVNLKTVQLKREALVGLISKPSPCVMMRREHVMLKTSLCVEIKV